jgi:hypothetical protein
VVGTLPDAAAVVTQIAASVRTPSTSPLAADECAAAIDASAASSSADRTAAAARRAIRTFYLDELGSAQ